MKKYLCNSCSGPLDEYKKEEIITPNFCPYCVDERGELKSYKDILDGMIDYIEQDHPEIKAEGRRLKAIEWLRDGPVWGEKFTGVIIEESLEKKKVLKIVNIDKTKISKKNDPDQNHGFPTWHLHHVSFYKTEVDKVIKLLKKHLRKGKWYADFKGTRNHYIVFRNKVFIAIIGNKVSYKDFHNYGLKVGIPENQLNIM